MPRLHPLLRALADPHRRQILERVARSELAVKDLVARLEISQPAVSQHLAVLRRAGLVTARRSGRVVRYRANPGTLRPLIDWMARNPMLLPAEPAHLAGLLDVIAP